MRTSIEEAEQKLRMLREKGPTAEAFTFKKAFPAPDEIGNVSTDTWGAEVVLRDTRAKVLRGQHPHTDTVVMRFPVMAAVVQWHDSDAYQALVPLRMQAADVDLVSYQADS